MYKVYCKFTTVDPPCEHEWNDLIDGASYLARLQNVEKLVSYEIYLITAVTYERFIHKTWELAPEQTSKTLGFAD